MSQFQFSHTFVVVLIFDINQCEIVVRRRILRIDAQDTLIGFSRSNLAISLLLNAHIHHFVQQIRVKVSLQVNPSLDIQCRDIRFSMAKWRHRVKTRIDKLGSIVKVSPPKSRLGNQEYRIILVEYHLVITLWHNHPFILVLIPQRVCSSHLIIYQFLTPVLGYFLISGSRSLMNSIQEFVKRTIVLHFLCLL